MLGTVAVPATRLWGAQTERSRYYFAIGDPLVWRWPRSVIRALGLVKGAAADANFQTGGLEAEVAAFIVQAAAEVSTGRWDAEFPLGVFQTGSGTHTNMNANEVIANRANQLAGGTLGIYTPVHPIDHVNLGQSSNDVFPTVMHLATLDALQTLEGPVLGLSASLARQAERWRDLPILGRTHLQDATPIMLGDVVGSWTAQLDDAWARVVQARAGLHALPLGATAVGTGLNAHPDFGARAIALLAATTGHSLHQASNLPAALAAHDTIAGVSAAMRGLAGVLFKLANDIRLYASGPRGGFGELRLPANEPGSSIMPGKVNPSQCEALTMVAVHVFGCDATVAWANAQGPLQLNDDKPGIRHNVLEPTRLLADACRAFTTFCVDGLEAEPARIEANLQTSLMLVTALVPHIGYEPAAAIALTALRDGLSLRDAALASGAVRGEDFDRWVDPAEMARPAG